MCLEQIAFPAFKIVYRLEIVKKKGIQDFWLEALFNK